MPTKRISVKLPEGFYLAIRELAKRLNSDISDMAGVMLALGLTYVRDDKLSEETRALLVADILEAAADTTRMLAKMSKADRDKFLKNATEALRRLNEMLNIPPKRE